MHINDLPEDIIIPIIQYAAPSHANNPVQISVCKKWRSAGIPTVYRSIQILFDEESDTTVAENPQKCIKSNASIIAATNNEHFVKHLELRLTYSQNLSLGLSNIVDFMSHNSNCLKSVTSLDLWVSDTSSVFLNQTASKRVDMIFLRKVVGRIHKLAPHITRLDAHGLCGGPFFESFSGLLTAAYSSQLGRMIIRNKVIVMPELQNFESLTQLTITINNESVRYLPYVYVESLVFLRMKNVPIDFTWATNSQTVVFSNLRDLDVKYDWYNVKDTLIDKKVNAAVQSRTLYFPAIKRLRIRGIVDHYPALLYGKFGSNMELVEIAGTKRAIDYVLVEKVPQAKNVVMDVSIDKHILNTDELCAIESLSSSHKVNVIVKINVLRRSAIPMLDEIALSRLTELRILPSMDINRAINLISRLPSLEYLRICLNQTEILSDNEHASETSEQYGICVKPISKTLSIISLQFSAYDRESVNNIYAFKRLCLAIPSLSKVHAFQIPKNVIAEFVEQYKHNYPHLAKTRIYA
ncbi:hypothetical protein H4S08_000477 [Coemansia sp. RSA 1365]|nr:hypothetical protein H4S08_000477 [Coemansia sp. RSA 1365]